MRQNSKPIPTRRTGKQFSDEELDDYGDFFGDMNDDDFLEDFLGAPLIQQPAPMRLPVHENDVVSSSDITPSRNRSSSLSSHSNFSEISTQSDLSSASSTTLNIKRTLSRNEDRPIPAGLSRTPPITSLLDRHQCSYQSTQENRVPLKALTTKSKPSHSDTLQNDNVDPILPSYTKLGNSSKVIGSKKEGTRLAIHSPVITPHPHRVVSKDYDTFFLDDVDLESMEDSSLGSLATHHAAINREEESLINSSNNEKELVRLSSVRMNSTMGENKSNIGVRNIRSKSYTDGPPEENDCDKNVFDAEFNGDAYLYNCPSILIRTQPRLRNVASEQVLGLMSDPVENIISLPELSNCSTKSYPEAPIYNDNGIDITLRSQAMQAQLSTLRSSSPSSFDGVTTFSGTHNIAHNATLASFSVPTTPLIGYREGVTKRRSTSAGIREEFYNTSDLNIPQQQAERVHYPPHRFPKPLPPLSPGSLSFTSSTEKLITQGHSLQSMDITNDITNDAMTSSSPILLLPEIESNIKKCNGKISTQYSFPEPRKTTPMYRTMSQLIQSTSRGIRYNKHIRRAKNFMKTTPLLRWIEPVSLLLALVFQSLMGPAVGLQSIWLALPAAYLFSHLLRLFFSFTVMIGQEIIGDYRMRQAIKKIKKSPKRVILEQRFASGYSQSQSFCVDTTSSILSPSPLEVTDTSEFDEESWFIRLLRRVFVQRLPFLRPLNRAVARWDFFGVALSSLVGDLSCVPVPPFLREPFYSLFARFTGVKLEEVALPLRSYRTLQDFFTRQLAPGARRISKSTLVSPVDGTVTSCGRLSSRQIRDVKGINYIWRDFLGEDLYDKYIPDEKSYFQGFEENVENHENLENQVNQDDQKDQGLNIGINTMKHGNSQLKKNNVHDDEQNYTHDVYFYTIRLDLGDYHRFHAPASMTVDELTHYPGTLFPVNPLVIRFFPNHFNTNERVVLSGDWEGGRCSLVAVGEYSVGSISINFDKSVRTNRVIRDYKNPNFKFASFKGTSTDAYRFQYLKNSLVFPKGAEMGMFRLGSTVVFVFQVPKEEKFVFIPQPNQRVRLGEPLGIKIPKK